MIDFYDSLSNQYELIQLYLGENIDNKIVSNESVLELKKFTKLVKNLEIQISLISF